MSLRPRGYGAAWAWASLVVLPLLLLVIHLTIGARPEHFVFVAAFGILAWVGPTARRLSALSAPLVVTGLTYDLLRLFKDWRGQVHVADLYLAERTLFPWFGGGSLGDLIASQPNVVFDVLCGIVYITYLPEAIGLAALLFFKDKRAMATLTWSFALISVTGWAMWILWPAAPPWYVDIYGLGPAVMDAPPSAAGAARFDAVFGIDMFQSFYERSWNVFGAMPSLHVGYAVIAALAVWPVEGRWGCWLRRFTVVYAVVMTFGSVYLRHHYLLDGVFGAALAFACNRVVVHVLRALERRGAQPVAIHPVAMESAPSDRLLPENEEVASDVHHGLAHR